MRGGAGKSRPARPADSELERYRIQVGRDHNVTPGHIVGAIANEAGLDGGNIGRIQMYDRTATVDLPRGMPPHILQHLKKVRIFQQPLAIELDSGQPAGAGKQQKKKGSGKGKPKQ
jgi:ATP-dependent RNA helicase DeaD